MAEEFVFGQGQGDEKAGDPAGREAGSGATDIFGIIAPAKREEPQAAAAEGRAAPPKVHSVVFKSDASRVEETDQLMNLLRSPAPAATPMQPAAPAPTPGSAAPASGGFTQLLRALNYEQVKEAAPTMEAAVARVQPEAVPVVPAAEAKTAMLPRVTSFQPPASPPLMAAPVIEAQAESAAVPGSFTQLFQSVDTPAAELAPKVESPAAPVPGSFTQVFRALEAAPEVATAEPVEEAPASLQVSVPVTNDGSFTQMFRAPVIAPVEQAKVEPPPVAASQEPGSFTRMFETVSAPQVAPVAVGPATAPAAPGSFTQVFRALNVAPVEAQAEARPVAPAAVSLVPGSFTQMFSTPAVVPVEAARVEAARMEPPVPLTASGPGSFTQMFQAVSEVPKEVPASAPPASGPGSFTQMFRALDAAPAPAPIPAASGGLASPMSGAYRPVAEPVRAAPVFPPSVPTSPQSPIASSGGLTQLLRALDQPGQQIVPPYAPPLAAPASPVQQPGSFTAVYGKLDTNAAAPLPAPPASAPVRAVPAPASIAGRDATQAFHLPQAPAMPQVAGPIQAGPSEFTRILNASMVREAALRGGGTPEAQAAAAPAAPPAGPPAFAGMPAVPKMPEMPKVKLPEPPKLAAPKLPAVGGMQQYVPLLLIVVIFLLLAILVAVVFLMKK